MPLKDRGKLKWMPAHFTPEHRSMLRNFYTDMNRQPQPIVDEHELAEFDSRICYAMEFTLPVNFTLWSEGYTYNVLGYVHYLDELNRRIRVELDDGSFTKLLIENVIEVKIIED